VTHSHFIRDLLKEEFTGKVDKLRNNDAVRVQYELSSDGFHAMKDTPGTPKSLLGSRLDAWSEDYLCGRDYQRCVKYDVDAMGLSSKDAEGTQSALINPPGDRECCVP